MMETQSLMKSLFVHIPWSVVGCNQSTSSHHLSPFTISFKSSLLCQPHPLQFLFCSAPPTTFTSNLLPLSFLPNLPSYAPSSSLSLHIFSLANSVLCIFLITLPCVQEDLIPGWDLERENDCGWITQGGG